MELVGIPCAWLAVDGTTTTCWLAFITLHGSGVRVFFSGKGKHDELAHLDLALAAAETASAEAAGEYHPWQLLDPH